MSSRMPDLFSRRSRSLEKRKLATEKSAELERLTTILISGYCSCSGSIKAHISGSLCRSIGRKQCTYSPPLQPILKRWERIRELKNEMSAALIDIPTSLYQALRSPSVIASPKPGLTLAHELQGNASSMHLSAAVQQADAVVSRLDRPVSCLCWITPFRFTS